MNTLIIFLQRSRNTWMIRTMISARNFCHGQMNFLQNAENNTKIKPLSRAANYSESTHSGAFTGFQHFLTTHVVMDYIWEIFKGVSPTIIALITIAINYRLGKRKELKVYVKGELCQTSYFLLI